MRRPRLLAIVVVAQVGGVLLAEHGQVHGTLAVAALGLAASVALRRASLAAVAVALAAGAAVHATTLGEANDARVLAHGEHVVDARVRQVREGTAGIALWLALAHPALPRSVELFVPRGRIAERPPIAAARMGDRWRLRIRLRPPHSPANPGALDRTRWLARRGVGARASLVHPALAVRTGGGLTSWLQYPIVAVRRRASSGLEVHGPGGALLRALALGDRRGLESERAAFGRLGVAHLLAISGLHLGLVLAAGYGTARGVIRSLPLGGCSADTRVTALALALACALTYAVFAGFGVPLRRALGFAVAAAVCLRLRRPGATRSGLWAAASVLLALEPAALFDLGPQLSFAAAAALVYGRPGPGALASRIGGALRDGLRVSSAALAATAPLLAAHGLATGPVALFANALLVPWTGAVLLPAALLAAALAAVGVAEPIVSAAAALASATLDATRSVADALPTLPARPPASPGLVGAAGVLALASLRARATFGRALLAVCVVGLLRFASAGVDAGSSYAVALDVGSGDALVLRSGSHAVLIDAGLAIPDALDLGRSRVLPALTALGIDRLDLAVATHADADHVGGLPAVLEALPVATLWLPAGQQGDPGFARLLGVARARGVVVESISAASPVVQFGERLALEPVWPPADLAVARRNASSIVLRATLSGTRLLLTGDLGRDQERALLRSGRALRADVLKLGHHGSATSTGTDWLDAVRPAAAILSAACQRRGLPATSLLDRVRARGISLWWTARDGAVFVQSSPLTVHSLAPGGGCRRQLP